LILISYLFFISNGFKFIQAESIWPKSGTAEPRVHAMGFPGDILIPPLAKMHKSRYFNHQTGFYTIVCMIVVNNGIATIKHGKIF
jgi:hypothetical protein